MSTDQPTGTLRELAEKIQRSIVEATAKRATEAKGLRWETESRRYDDLSDARAKIKKANDY